MSSDLSCDLCLRCASTIHAAPADRLGMESLTPSARESLLMICWFGTAFPLSYSWTTLGATLILFASCAWVRVFTQRPCLIAVASATGHLARAWASVLWSRDASCLSLLVRLLVAACFALACLASGLDWRDQEMGAKSCP
eukprot:TRINITY_DN3958_c0_g1_i4.p1 TRINITY_DN3958_c0_g1~~TRINITY_DN3958_c0_g1_i4.p1  ORF type:complete len:140 (+),score=4.04 TRINITY_DN3958_c0_g1_i4:584-1003(+)